MFHILITTFALVLSASTVVAQTQRNLAYGPDRAQKMDIYAPDAARNAPIVVMLHGGAWRIGDKSNRNVWKAKSAHYNAKGYIFVSVNTRLVPDANPLEQAQDLARAMAMIQRDARQWGGDPDRLVLMGHSAGAHVASLLATRSDLQRAAGLDAWNGTVSLDTAGFDVEAIMRDSPVRLYRRAFGSNPKLWAAASPMGFVDRRDGPFLVVCSTRRDRPCQDGRTFLKSADPASRLIAVDMSHEAINAELGASSAYTIAVDHWIERQF